jgi:hypothetical protein
MITAATPPTNPIQNTASKIFLFMVASMNQSHNTLPDAARTAVTVITFRTP